MMIRREQSVTSSLSPPWSCSFSLSLTLTPLVSLSRTRKRAAKGGETVRALKGRFTVMHVDGRLLSSAPPVCHTALAAAQRRSLWKASTHTVAGEGREDRGGGVRVVCVCVCGVASIVVGLFFFVNGDYRSSCCPLYLALGDTHQAQTNAVQYRIIRTLKCHGMISFMAVAF